LFDGAGATIKDRRRVTTDLPCTEELLEISEFDENALPKMAVFNSTGARFETERCRSLGPAAYINDTEPIY